MKICVKCEIEQPLENFYRASGTRDGLRGDCKACNNAPKQARYQRDPAAEIARVKRWQQANPDRVNATQRKRRADPSVKLKMRAYHLRRVFDITIEQYNEMLVAQGGGCAICGRAAHEGSSLHVDHDHESGRIRGLLCFRCNNSLGDLDDDPDLLWAALRYLGPDAVPRDPELDVRLAELVASRG